VKPRIAVRSGQWDFLAAMVQAGVGIAILPEPICQRLDKQTLRWIPLESDLRWQLGMIWREGVYLSHSAQAWLECCEGFWVPETPGPVSELPPGGGKVTDSRSTALPAGRDRAAALQRLVADLPGGAQVIQLGAL
jgi:hypothetical protein